VAEVDQLCRNGRLHPYARKKSQSRQRYGQYRRQRRDVVQVASTSSAKALLIRDHTAPDDPASIFATVQQNLTTSCVDPEPGISGGARYPVPALQTATLSSLSATFSVKPRRQATRRATNAGLRHQTVGSTSQLIDISVVRRQRRRSTKLTVLQLLTQLVAVEAIVS